MCVCVCSLVCWKDDCVLMYIYKLRCVWVCTCLFMQVCVQLVHTHTLVHVQPPLSLNFLTVVFSACMHVSMCMYCVYDTVYVCVCVCMTLCVCVCAYLHMW